LATYFFGCVGEAQTNAIEGGYTLGITKYEKHGRRVLRKGFFYRMYSGGMEAGGV